MALTLIDAALTRPTSDELNSFDAIVVGAGFAGAVIARELAERGGKRVAVIERRNHIAGNTYDHLDERGVLIHAYGPHIFHTAFERAYTYLSRFTQWRHYEHEVLANIHGTLIPVPFNLNSIAASFDAEKAQRITDLLLATFGQGTKVPIIELRKADDALLKELAEYVYENVFLHYTEKQWGLTPEEIDPAVTARVPVLVDWDNRYFQDAYQGMPGESYTALFEQLLDHENIEVFVNLDALELLDFSGGDAPEEPFSAIKLAGELYEGLVIYTGALDELSGRRFGLLPYRSLDFVYRNYDQSRVQAVATVNFTVSEDYTRTSEYTWLTGQNIGLSSVAEEYPRAYTDPETQIPYYPIINDENLAFYARYQALFGDLRNFHPLGRLAEYRYYNIDQIVLRALEMADELIG
jgi:UDP-galactopyranose mutase